MSKPLVKVEGVSKKFCRSLRRSLWYGLNDLGSEIFGRHQGRHGALRPDEFWAVRDVSFELRRGECLGLIGPNGAGKSTLLKMLNGLIKPDQGRIEMRGRVGALIELGAGFNPILTGRENIYVNGTMLGFTKQEMEAKFAAVVDFAGIAEFLDTPVQNYSSGMKVRLGFAIAAQLEPDVLILDEVLAVGDVGFQLKCMGRIRQILQNAAVIFVSHSMPMINRYSTRAILLDKGQAVNDGDADAVIESYYDLFAVGGQVINCADGSELEHFDVVNTDGAPDSEVAYGKSMRISFAVKIGNNVKYPVCKILVLNRERQVVAGFQSLSKQIFNDDNRIECTLEIEKVVLAPGKYYLSLLVHREDMKSPLIWCDASREFQVVGGRKDFGSEIFHLEGISKFERVVP